MFKRLAVFMLALVSCAPSAQVGPQGKSLSVATFSKGIAWGSGRTVYILQGPRFELEKINLPANLSGLAWWNEEVYASLPDANWVIRVQGVSDVRPVGRTRALSNNLIYLENGGTLDPSGNSTSYRFPGFIEDLLSVDGTDYVLASGKIYQLQEGKTTFLRNSSDAFLYAVPNGVQTAAVPTVQLRNKQFVLQGQKVLLKDLQNEVLNTWSLPSPKECHLGVVYDQVMLVCKDGFFQRFDLELNAVGSAK